MAKRKKGGRKKSRNPGMTEELLKIKHKELDLMISKEANRSTLKSPFGVAVVGGVIALLSGVLGNLIQGHSNLSLERQKQESQLIFHAVAAGGDNIKARKNLAFMLKAGLINDNGKIQQMINDGDEIPSFEALQKNFYVPQHGEGIQFVPSN